MGMQSALIFLYHLPPYHPPTYSSTHPPIYLPAHPSLQSFIWHLLTVSYMLGPVFFQHSTQCSFKPLSLLPAFLFPFEVSSCIHTCISTTSTCWVFPHSPCCFHFLLPTPIVTTEVQALRWWAECLVRRNIYIFSDWLGSELALTMTINGLKSLLPVTLYQSTWFHFSKNPLLMV